MGKFDEPTPEAVTAMDLAEIRAAYEALRAHHVAETTALLAKVGALSADLAPPTDGDGYNRAVEQFAARMGMQVCDCDDHDNEIVFYHDHDDHPVCALCAAVNGGVDPHAAHRAKCPACGHQWNWHGGGRCRFLKCGCAAEVPP